MWVFVDGACLDNGKPWARAGYGVWFGDSSWQHLNCSGTFPGRQTNQRAEIQAAITAIEIATQEEFCCLQILTDSKYLIDGATEWIKKWWNNNWRSSRGEPVVSKDKWLELEEAINRFHGRISWKHVEAHNGTYGNEQADRLAREAASNNYEDDEESDSDYNGYDNNDSGDWWCN